MDLSELPIVVCKFGGTSVSTRARWETIADVARAHLAASRRPVVVCSAVSGVSNLLEGLLDAALASEHGPILDEITGKHQALADELGVDMEALIGEDLSELRRMALGASLIREVSPRLKANVMARGELMSTRLGAAFISEVLGLGTIWRDARGMLAARAEEHTNPHRHYLSSACDFAYDAARAGDVRGESAPVVLTQGFIATDARGDTVLLGRGGSDTSAAYLASKLGAERLEIWTDVPGMFTANPRQVPGARLLRRLDYAEAQELASTGAKVLHPRCLEPVRRAHIPLHICCTQAPHLDGTIISDEVVDAGPQVKAISGKSRLTLVSMDTVGMWQEVGFLADAFACFKKNGLSIDLVATSETNVTVSLDPVANALDRATLQDLLDDLRPFCRARLIEPCASVSLVGHGIRAILHRLGGALEVLEEQQIYMMSQAASDLNLTFVITEDQSDRLIRKLHALLFGARASDALLGPTWKELFEDGDTAQTGRRRWWTSRAEALVALSAERGGEPLYVYDGTTLDEAAAAVQQIEALDQVFFAIKSNPNPDILRRFATRGLSFECVSPGEVAHLFEVLPELTPDRVLFTPNFAPIQEYAEMLERGVHVTLDNLHPLRHHPEVFAGASLLLRVDPGVGAGHHKHVRTAGRQSKFGIAIEDLPEAATRIAEAGARVIGLHSHVGSGIRTPETWLQNATFLADQAERHFPDARIINLGGGLGVPERPDDEPLPLDLVAASLNAFAEAHPDLTLWMEPGRYLVAQSGVLLATVTQLKVKGDHAYVGVNTGMNSLIRPSLYGAFHEIVNLSRHGQPQAMTADIVGPICETGDVLGYSRRLPATEEGDVLLIANAGAYGRAMSSQYNLRAPAAEVVV